MWPHSNARGIRNNQRVKRIKCVREAVCAFDCDARALIALVRAPYKISVRFNDASKTESVLSRRAINGRAGPRARVEKGNDLFRADPRLRNCDGDEKERGE